MRKYSKEIIISSAVMIILLFFAIRYFYLKSVLKKDGVYVIGWRTFYSPGGENGNSFKYKFNFQKKLYEVSFTDAYFSFKQSDSLLYLKVLPQNPSGVCDFLTETKIPKCFRIEDMPVEGWKKLPQDTCK